MAGKNTRQEPGGWTWSRSHGGVQLTGLPSLISQVTQDLLSRDGTALLWTGPSHTNYESRMCPTNLPIGNLLGHFLN